MKKPLAVTLTAAVLILITAFATLAVLTALAGQESGLQKPKAVHCCTNATGA